MPQAKLIVYQPGHAVREFPVTGVVFLGSHPENTLPLDALGVSKYHARIYFQQGELWVSDENSTNGTYVNEEEIEGKRRLHDGDVIGVGEDVSLLVALPDERQPSSNPLPPTPLERPTGAPANLPGLPGDETPGTSALRPALSVPPAALPVSGTLAVPSQTAPTPPPAASVSNAPTVPVWAVVAIGFTALTFLAVAGFVVSRFWPSQQAGCSDDMLRITAPRKGDTITRPAKIKAEAKGDTNCIASVIFKLNGDIIGSDAKAPYEAELDPANFKELAARGGESLTITLTVIDQEGKPHVQEDGKIYIYLEAESARATPTPPPANPAPDAAPPPAPPPPSAGGASDIRDLSNRLATQLSGKSGYVLDEAFVNNVNRFTKEYRTGAYDKAYQYRRVINKAFTDQGLDVLFGYVLAFNRSQFDNRRAGRGLGLWQLPPEVVNGYLSGNETAETVMADVGRSSGIAAQYTKALLSTFNGAEDFMYVVACYGLTLNEVGKIRSDLASQVTDEGARRNFTQTAQTLGLSQAQVEQVQRFFAAGVVGENPQMFGGARNEKPLSDLK